MTNNNNILNFILKCKEIYFVIPVIIYIIGFLCSQGSFSAINGTILISDIAFPIYPFNFEVYLYKGLFISFGLLLPSVWFAILLLEFINKFGEYQLKTGFFIILASVLFHSISIWIYQLSKEYMGSHLYQLYLFLYFVFYFFLLIYIFSSARASTSNYRRINFFISSTFLVISLCANIYWVGQITESNKISNFLDGQAVKKMHIETDKETYDLLIYDINKDLATGIDKSRNTITIPMDKIK
ncbi:hypothetical protein [Paenibacillus sp. Aloe-11]|uniref:hypothetical protein n=1 Tax=Paenibacillus sp. Aloe-11 TaxID=1050222 RepID=UPI0002F24488|nr:hypothetical protein [Paenibacillus sp. Aloe-11]